MSHFFSPFPIAARMPFTFQVVILIIRLVHQLW